jgi:hypothetical protein
MTTESFLAADPFAILHTPRCVSIARLQMERNPKMKKQPILRLIEAAEQADWNWVHGKSYHVDQEGFDKRTAEMNAACVALLKAVGEEYT